MYAEQRGSVGLSEAVQEDAQGFLWSPGDSLSSWLTDGRWSDESYAVLPFVYGLI